MTGRRTRLIGEIAKTLGRPTSTVTREVARNGGPERYQADAAHEATKRRTRHRKPSSANHRRGRVAKAVRDFEEQFSAVLGQTGLPRMMARVLAALHATNSGSLTAADLAAHLRVSPASISYLEAQHLVRRERDDQQRRDRYVLADDAWYHAMLAAVRTSTMVAEAARRGVEVLNPGTPAAARLEGTALFLDQISNDLVRSLRQWRHPVDTDVPLCARPGCSPTSTGSAAHRRSPC
nr:MarR family transcriptional regulator [Kibdelosporangium sp. MJ126-NF4]